MITILIKRPHEDAEVLQIADASELEELVGGDYEIVHDDRLDGFHLVVNEEARGIQANNFPISSDGFLDWVYGPCVFVKADGSSLSHEDIASIQEYLASKV
ncbi:DUF3846 domain-containing protein [Brevibacillus sp. H7]|uniref:DUF3846 domain-containing protein n=1 Tax=Brevibacillus sp. H7 TaxID=3349138 RepID=UPI0037F96883